MQTRFRFRVLSAFGALMTALLLVVPNLGAQQGGTVTGRVIDSGTLQPIAAVQVSIGSLGIGGLTQQNGRYLLPNVPAGTHELSVTRIGYRTTTATITIGAGQTVEQNFSVAEEALQLDAIIVTGTAGGQQRRAIGNAVTVIDAAAITAQVPITNMQQLLSARTPGLNFTRADGGLGQGSAINIRGFSSLASSNQPLIYVDGIRVDNSFSLGPDNFFGTFMGTDSDGSSGSALDDINPEDIESIEIIKGPAAATLYGTEASAGVIQIITKRGSVGAPEFTATIRVGEAWMSDPAGVLGAQYGCRAGQNSSRSVTGSSRRGILCPERELIQFNIYDYTAGNITKLNPEVVSVNEPYDLFQTGLSQTYNLGVTGGTETVRYFLSADYYDATGIVNINTINRATLRTNVDIVFSDAFSVAFRASYQEGEANNLEPDLVYGGRWHQMLTAQANHLISHPFNDADNLAEDMGGTCPLNPLDPGGRFVGTPFEQFGDGTPVGGGECYAAHQPLSEPGDADGFADRDPKWYQDVVALRDFSRFTSSITATHSIGNWATQRLVVGIDNNWTQNTNLTPRSIGRDNFPFPATSDGRITISAPEQTRFSFDYSASATYDLNSTFQFVTSAGVQYNRFQQVLFVVSGEGLPSALFTSLSNATTFDLPLPRHDITEARTLGFYFQEQIGINGRLFFTAAVRGDDASSFGEATTRSYYPKLSSTWTVSEESFWNVDFINSMRVRTAWGKAGRQPSVFARTPQYGSAVGPGLSNAIRLDAPGNPLVGPENSQEIEVGLDIAILDDRVFGEFTYFKQWVDDALVGQSLAPSEAFTGSKSVNFGKLENWGWEMALDWTLFEGDAFGANIRFSGDHTENRVTRLSTEISQNANFQEGWMRPNVASVLMDSAKWEDPTDVYDSEILAWCDFGDPLTRSGLGQGGLSVPCDLADDFGQELLIGSAFPSHTWSIAPTLRFLQNRLEVFALAEGRYGTWRYCLDCAERSGLTGDQNAKGSWLETDPELVAGQTFNDDRYQGRFDASFWRVREIGARYQIPQSISGNLGMDRASISVSATNLWTVWRRQWRDRSGTRIPDPETQQGGSNNGGQISSGGVPPLTAYNISLRLSF